MSDRDHTDEAPSRFAEIRQALGEWWGQFTPEQQRKYLFRAFVVVLMLVLLIGGCSVLKSYTKEKQQEKGRESMPAVTIGGPDSAFQGTGREGMPAGGEPPALKTGAGAPGAVPGGAPPAGAPGAGKGGKAGDAAGRSRMP